jgi:hypothetical protein
MRHRIYQWSILLGLLTLTACAGAPASTSATLTPTRTATTTQTTTPAATPAATPTATPALPIGFIWYTSHDQTYQIAYPSNWQVATGTQGKTLTVDFTGPGQIFEVREFTGAAGSDPAKMVNDYCQAMQPGIAANPVQTKSVSLGGQSWTRANCDAGAQSPAIQLIVEVVIYQGVAYQIDYQSPIVEFSRDDKTYYAKMEQSFRFLS